MPPPVPLPATVPSPPPRIKPKIGKNVVFFTLSVVFLFALFVAAVLIAVAKSGIVRIPLFSLLYHGPAPTRIVKWTQLSTSQFEAEITARLAAQLAERKPSPYRFMITEEQLTGLLRMSLGAALRDKAWNIQYAQLVVRPTALEFFGRFTRGIWREDLLVRFMPRLHNGSVSFLPTSIQVGDYRLPPAIAETVIGFVFERDLGSWSVAFGNAALQDIQMSDGMIEIRVSPRAQ